MWIISRSITITIRINKSTIIVSTVYYNIAKAKPQLLDYSLDLCTKPRHANVMIDMNAMCHGHGHGNVNQCNGNAMPMDITLTDGLS